MQTVLKIAAIISIVISTIKIGLGGGLTPQTAAIILVGSMLILAGGPKLFTIVAAVLGLFIFIKLFAGGNPVAQGNLLQSILTLVLVCAGIYIMFRGFFRPSNRRR